MKKNLLIPLFITAFLLFPGISSSNSVPHQSKQFKEALEHEVTVTLKLVQVYVTDTKGNPVADLRKSNFILYDNSKIKKITDFERHILLKPKKAVELKSEEEKPVPVPKITRKFFILIDVSTGRTKGLEKSKKAALHFIETKLQETDEVGVLSFSALKGLNLHSYLTTDHKKIRGLIGKLKVFRYKPQGGITLAGSMAEAERELARIAGKKGEGKIAGQTSRQSGATFSDPESAFRKQTLVKFSNAVKDFAKSIRSIPGYKNIIFFSSGIGNLLYGEDPTFRYTWEEMGKELAASNSPVYTINTGGAEFYQKKWAALGEGSLKMLSEISGGKYLGIIEYYKAVAEELQNITSNYYVLGYYIDEKWDGKYHKIKVEVKRKGCVVHAQAGYFNPKPFKEFSPTEKLIHLIDLAFGEKQYFQEPFNLHSTALSCSDKKDNNLILLSELPLEKMKEKGVTGRKTEVVTFIVDKDNNLVSSIKGELNFSLIPFRRIYYYTILSLSPGTYEGRVVIRNEETGKGAVASTSIVIPEYVDSGIFLHPPLVLIPDKKAHYLKIEKKREKKEAGETLSLNAIYPFISNEHSPLITELEKEASVLLAILRLSIGKTKEPEIKLSSSLIQRSTDKITKLPLAILATETKEKTEIFLIKLKLPELMPGEYTLEITAEGKTAKKGSSVSKTFKVK
ncbi:MAG: VWA domain-containing protein [Candidatus Aminicenantales bacterium]